MVCDNCGKKIDKAAKFCKSCGCKIETETGTIEGKRMFFFPILYLYKFKKRITASLCLLIIMVLLVFFVKNAVAILDGNQEIKKYKSELKIEKELIEEYTEQRDNELYMIQNEEIENKSADNWGKVGNIADEFGNVVGEANPMYGLASWAIQGLSEYAQDYYRAEDENIRQNRLQEIESKYNTLIDEAIFNSEKITEQIKSHKSDQRIMVIKNVILLLLIIMVHSGFGCFCILKFE